MHETDSASTLRRLLGDDDGRHVAGQALRGGRVRLPVQPDLLGGLHPAALRLHLVRAHDASVGGKSKSYIKGTDAL